MVKAKNAQTTLLLIVAKVLRAHLHDHRVCNGLENFEEEVAHLTEALTAFEAPAEEPAR